MSRFKYLLLLNFLLVGAAPWTTWSSAHADQSTQVVSTDTDAYAGTEFLDVVQDASHSMTSVVFRQVDGPPVTLTLAQLESGPQVLKIYKGHNVTYLSTESGFSATSGGYVNMKFLTNAITGSSKNFRISLEVQGAQFVLRSVPNPQDNASDGNAYTTVFDHLFMKKNTFLGETVGIAQVQPNEQ